MLACQRKKYKSKKITDAELIREDYVIPEFLWLRYFIEAHGFKVEEAVMYQDNLRDIILENNGILASGNWMKHIHVR